MEIVLEVGTSANICHQHLIARLCGAAIGGECKTSYSCPDRVVRSWIAQTDDCAWRLCAFLFTALLTMMLCHCAVVDFTFTFKASQAVLHQLY